MNIFLLIVIFEMFWTRIVMPNFRWCQCVVVIYRFFILKWNVSNCESKMFKLDCVFFRSDTLLLYAATKNWNTRAKIQTKNKNSNLINFYVHNSRRQTFIIFLIHHRTSTTFMICLFIWFLFGVIWTFVFFT